MPTERTSCLSLVSTHNRHGSAICEPTDARVLRWRTRCVPSLVILHTEAGSSSRTPAPKRLVRDRRRSLVCAARQASGTTSRRQRNSGHGMRPDAKVIARGSGGQEWRFLQERSQRSLGLACPGTAHWCRGPGRGVKSKPQVGSISRLHRLPRCLCSEGLRRVFGTRS